MSTPVDPSWLPSTVAQSTAALVGIIGGLLVARFVSIDSKQNTLSARLREAQERLRFVTKVRDDLEARSRRTAAIDVLVSYAAVQALIGELPGGQTPTEGFLDSISEDGWAAEEFEPYLSEARQVVRDCYSKIVMSVTAENGHTRSWQPVRRELTLPEDEWDELREQVHDQLKHIRTYDLDQTEAERQRAASPHAVPIPPSIMRAMRYPISAADRIAEVIPDSTYRAASSVGERQRQAAAEGDVVRAQFEYDLADRALKDSALPSNLMAAVWMLIGLTLVGLVLPVIALFALPSYDGRSWRLIVLVAFCIGIAGLLAYLWFTARRLSAPKTSGHPLLAIASGWVRSRGGRS